MLKCQIAVTPFEVKALIKGQISLGEEILYSEPPLGCSYEEFEGRFTAETNTLVWEA